MQREQHSLIFKQRKSCSTRSEGATGGSYPMGPGSTAVLDWGRSPQGREVLTVFIVDVSPEAIRKRIR